MEDNQDYEKIQIQAPANVLKNLDIVASVKVEGEGAETGSTNESGFIIDTDTYGFELPECVTGIILPKGTTTIRNNNLSSYPYLQTITILESVTSINGWAFDGCSKLKTINYTGTEEQWNAIDKESSWNDGCPSDMVINYNYQG